MDGRLRRLEEQVLASPGDEDARGRLRASLSRVADLWDRKRWLMSPATSQDRVLEVVGNLLGSAFEIQESANYQAGKAAHRIGSFVHVATGLRLHAIPGDTFIMGSEDETELELPVHAVQVPPLLLGCFPVRQGEWDRVLGRDERNWRGTELPIEGVSWHEAREWLVAAGGALRLPSEAEWEYACRAGTTSAYFWGDTMSEDHCWFGDERGWQTRAPTLHLDRSNAFGMVDMSGNVAEWCEDAYLSSYKGAPTDGSPYRSRWNWLRIVRGGDSFNRAGHCRSARRGMVRASDRGAGIGFRAARSLPL
jgi:formylglycine-generating enzyme required for sulfatase activity